MSINHEISSKIDRIKKIISNLINNGDIDSAKSVIEKSLHLFKDDADFSSIMGTVYYIENNFDKALDVLKNGLLIDYYNIDINYNLGVIYESLNNYKLSYFYYYKAFNLTQKNELKSEINQKLLSLKQKIDNIEEVVKRPKIAFFVKKGMDSFINDIIKGLSEGYDTRKIVVTDYKQIDEGMQWADICWFEWCDELVIYGSRHKLASEKKIFCRLHRYEAFTNYIFQVNWENVDKIIFVAKHIMDYVNNKLNNVIYSKSIVIPNGIDMIKFNFKKRIKGYNLAYLGYLNYRKAPNLLLQVFKKLHDKDKRYKLYIGGKFQDEENISYFNYIVKEMGLTDYIIFNEWVDDVNEWLEDKDYVISCSISEGHPVGIMEAMAKGIKPIIHNFVGAKDIYPSKWVWNTIDEAVEMILSDEYDSNIYRNFINNNYSFEIQISNISKIFNKILIIDKSLKNKITNDDISTQDVKNFYNQFSSYLKNDRERENPRHIYVKNRIKSIITPECSVLDLGCGIGITTEFVKSSGVKKVIGVDISEENIKSAREASNNIEYIVGDITSIDLGKKFDVILMIDVLEHIPIAKYKELFRTIKKHLQQDGLIYLTIPNYQYQEFIRIYRPDLMQIIDNSISLDMILSYCKNENLIINFFNIYGIDFPHQYNELILANEPIYTDIWASLIR